MKGRRLQERQLLMHHGWLMRHGEQLLVEARRVHRGQLLVHERHELQLLVLEK